VFVDPMWATGVANALTHGTLAAAIVEATLTGRISESEALKFFQREISGQSDFAHGLVKFVYQVNQIHVAHPFWKIRQASSFDCPPPGEIMRALSRDPSIAYFLKAFSGMGVADEVLAPLQVELTRLEQSPGDTGEHLRDLRKWVPALAPNVDLHRGLEFDGVRLLKGLVADIDSRKYFTSDPLSGEMLEAIDGRQCARELIESIIAGASADQRLITRFNLTATLVDAWRKGIVEVAFKP